MLVQQPGHSPRRHGRDSHTPFTFDTFAPRTDRGCAQEAGELKPEVNLRQSASLPNRSSNNSFSSLAGDVATTSQRPAHVNDRWQAFLTRTSSSSSVAGGRRSTVLDTVNLPRGLNTKANRSAFGANTSLRGGARTFSGHLTPGTMFLAGEYNASHPFAGDEDEWVEDCQRRSDIYSTEPALSIAPLWQQHAHVADDDTESTTSSVRFLVPSKEANPFFRHSYNGHGDQLDSSRDIWDSWQSGEIEENAHRANASLVTMERQGSAMMRTGPGNAAQSNPSPVPPRMSVPMDRPSSARSAKSSSSAFDRQTLPCMEARSKPVHHAGPPGGLAHALSGSGPKRHQGPSFPPQAPSAVQHWQYESQQMQRMMPASLDQQAYRSHGSSAGSQGTRAGTQAVKVPAIATYPRIVHKHTAPAAEPLSLSRSSGHHPRQQSVPPGMQVRWETELEQQARQKYPDAVPAMYSLEAQQFRRGSAPNSESHLQFGTHSGVAALSPIAAKSFDSRTVDPRSIDTAREGLQSAGKRNSAPAGPKQVLLAEPPTSAATLSLKAASSLRKNSSSDAVDGAGKSCGASPSSSDTGTNTYSIASLETQTVSNAHQQLHQQQTQQATGAKNGGKKGPINKLKAALSGFNCMSTQPVA